MPYRFLIASLVLFAALAAALPAAAKEKEEEYCLYSLQFLTGDPDAYRAAGRVGYKDTIKRYPGSLFDVKGGEPPRDAVECNAMCNAKKAELFKKAPEDSEVKKDIGKIRSTYFFCKFGEAGMFKDLQSEYLPYPPDPLYKPKPVAPPEPLPGAEGTYQPWINPQTR